jgi:hypothetical protein
VALAAAADDVCINYQLFWLLLPTTPKQEAKPSFGGWLDQQ